MFIVKHKNFFLLLSLVFVLLSFYSIFTYGLKFGIDFTGGAILEGDYKDARPDITVIKEKVTALGFGEFVAQTTGDKGIILKMKDLKEEERVKLVNALSITEGTTTTVLDVKSFDSVGPVIGAELAQKAWIAIGLVLLMIAIFIAFAFRQVSYPVSSYKYGFAALLALAHDTIIPTGIMAYWGHAYGTEVDLLFITALLAILGFSVHDTIVVFDRVRENLKNRISKNFDETVGASLAQTFVRSINTSATTIFTLLALYFLGGESTKTFALILSIGIFFGTYSSVFIASPLVLLMNKNEVKK